MNQLVSEYLLGATPLPAPPRLPRLDPAAHVVSANPWHLGETARPARRGVRA